MKFRQKKNRSFVAELTPLIDMVFILLIFFILSSSFLKPVIKLTLPKAETHAEQTQDNLLVLSLKEDQTLYLDQKQISPATLERHLKHALDKNPNLTIVFSGDHRIPYGLFVSIMDQLKKVGINTISLEHDESK